VVLSLLGLLEDQQILYYLEPQLNLGFLEVLQHPEHLVLLEHLWDL
jgi:hypothetical protein